MALGAFLFNVAIKLPDNRQWSNAFSPIAHLIALLACHGLLRHLWHALATHTNTIKTEPDAGVADIRRDPIPSDQNWHAQCRGRVLKAYSFLQLHYALVHLTVSFYLMEFLMMLFQALYDSEGDKALAKRLGLVPGRDPIRRRDNLPFSI